LERHFFASYVKNDWLEGFKMQTHYLKRPFMRTPSSIGIASLGLKIPSFFLDLNDLAQLRNTDPDK
jgi:hypothetical protein